MLSRHALGSFVHSGIHPLHLARQGYPVEIAATVAQHQRSSPFPLIVVYAAFTSSRHLLKTAAEAVMPFS
ncbi:DUF6988 family protein [Cupriavidus sp. TMH.W2]|uniref:DUF6988 family protein n=1 Tax=Cupriavidus sp. TMH.W2 TaxID=3434465 RepID=UPI003D785475